MESTKIELFQQILSAYGVGTNMVLRDYSNMQKLDNGFRLRLYEGASYESIQAFLEKKLSPNNILRMEDEFGMLFLIVPIPDRFLQSYESNAFVIGPFLKAMPDTAQIHSMMQSRGIPEALFTDISSVYSAFPVIAEIETFERTITNIAVSFFGVTYKTVEYSVSALEHPLPRLKEEPSIGLTSVEDRYAVEDEMLDAVTAGDYDRAREFHAKYSAMHIFPKTGNSIRSAQNFQLILNTLCRKAAEQGHVHPLYIDDLSSKFAILISEARSLHELEEISGEIVHKYCLLVKNYSIRGYSPIIRDIISYIDFHFAEDLNLSFFADMFNLTKTYLSSLFKKETGSTLTDFIHHVRMRRAITLINSSSLPISTIAAACGYNDINYFIRIFKRSYGMSPKQYQKMIGH